MVSCRDLLEVLDERYQTRSTLGDPTLADAILDRLIHNAYRLAL